MQVTVRRIAGWDNELYLRDEPYGENGVYLKPAQIAVLLTHPFPVGHAVDLPQPDASYSKCVVIHHAQSWHFRTPGGELIIASDDWPTVRAEIEALSRQK